MLEGFMHRGNAAVMYSTVQYLLYHIVDARGKQYETPRPPKQCSRADRDQPDGLGEPAQPSPVASLRQC